MVEPKKEPTAGAPEKGPETPVETSEASDPTSILSAAQKAAQDANEAGCDVKPDKKAESEGTPIKLVRLYLTPDQHNWLIKTVAKTNTKGRDSEFVASIRQAFASATLETVIVKQQDPNA